jgi:hypothetical protein
MTMMIFDYATKKELKASVGKPLKVIGAPFIGVDCQVVGCNKPELTGFNREFYAQVYVLNGLIKKVT